MPRARSSKEKPIAINEVHEKRKAAHRKSMANHRIKLDKRGWSEVQIVVPKTCTEFMRSAAVAIREYDLKALKAVNRALETQLADLRATDLEYVLEQDDEGDSDPFQARF